MQDQIKHLLAALLAAGNNPMDTPQVGPVSEMIAPAGSFGGGAFPMQNIYGNQQPTTKNIRPKIPSESGY